MTGNDGHRNTEKAILDRDDYLGHLNKIIDKIRCTNDFNRVARKVQAVSASADRLVLEMIVEEEHVNSKKTLHGGQTAALVDMITARAVGMTVRDKVMVSVELSVSYMLPVKLGDVVEIEAKVLKIGRNIAFTEAEFRRKSDGRLVAKGKHTIAFVSQTTASDDKSYGQF
ncbi:unnamed protein product [Thelazia callipaeda]|uniref:4HBT domain-containing protein n=1 Tax=Thelazia callipaeda TaxID=103827 RepID=A0A0N5CZN3_THECL|nr:unnamed protein product [Thelazia callipaeda]